MPAMGTFSLPFRDWFCENRTKARTKAAPHARVRRDGGVTYNATPSTGSVTAGLLRTTLYSLDRRCNRRAVTYNERETTRENERRFRSNTMDRV
eukprot:6481228-Pyramimonas_sp.AAC.2